MSMSRDAIAAKTWQFENAAGHVFCRQMRLCADGRIEGYRSFNEVNWVYSDGDIHLLQENGTVSCVLTPERAQLGDAAIFSGNFLLDQTHIVRHILRETVPQSSLYPMHVRWRESFDQFFEDNRIYLCHPFRIRGVYKPGTEVTIKHRVLVEPYATMPFMSFHTSGAFSYCGPYHSPQTLTVGRYSSIAAGMTLMGDHHPLTRVSTHPFSYDGLFQNLARKEFMSDFKVEPFAEMKAPAPVIGNDVWIGGEVLLRGGITLGDGCVIGARSIVTRDVPPYTIVAGSPARAQRLRFDEKIVERLLAVRWWQYNYIDLPRCWSEIERFLDELQDAAAAGRVKPFAPDKIDVGAQLQRLSS